MSVKICKMCGELYPTSGGKLYCNACNRVRVLKKGKAGGVVAKAKKSGYLPDLNITHIECTDCGGKAEHYDHRDYDLPLSVDPVCQSCNSARGEGLNSYSMADLNADLNQNPRGFSLHFRGLTPDDNRRLTVERYLEPESYFMRSKK